MRRPWVHTLRVTALASACLATGCGKDGGPAPHVVRVEQVTGRAWNEQSVPEQDAAAIVMRALDETPGLRAATAGEAALRVAVRYEVAASEAGEPFLLLSMHIDPPDELAAAFPGGLGMPLSLEREDGTIVLDRDLPIAARRMATLVQAQISLGRGERGALQGLLTSPDPELALLGLGWVHDHKPRGVAGAVAGLLGHQDDRIALLAIECLGMIGSSADAAALGRSVRLADRARAHRAYEALAALGGPEATEFLEFAARNEDDPDLAAAAQHALDRASGPKATGAHGAVPRGHRK